ncbi:MAG: hypothetical protein PHG90_06200 [Clostridia bacterium]|jgi:hypothetical protein|nr:hypothetical protein [Clostridia bacterium]NLT18778.1 hypothetical protein [Clostridiales bacterium]
MPYYKIKALSSKINKDSKIPLINLVMYGETKDIAIEMVKKRPEIRRNNPEVIKDVYEISEEKYVEHRCKGCKGEKKYFEVFAKGGHVGRDKYYECIFYICSENKIRAIDIVQKHAPRIKRDHIDGIFGANEISVEEFLEGNKRNDQDSYFHCNSKHEQKEAIKAIKPNIVKETQEGLKRRAIAKKIDTKKNNKGKRGTAAVLRNEYKYKKMNPSNKIEET